MLSGVKYCDPKIVLTKKFRMFPVSDEMTQRKVYRHICSSISPMSSIGSHSLLKKLATHITYFGRLAENFAGERPENKFVDMRTQHLRSCQNVTRALSYFLTARRIQMRHQRKRLREKEKKIRWPRTNAKQIGPPQNMKRETGKN